MQIFKIRTQRKTTTLTTTATTKILEFSAIKNQIRYVKLIINISRPNADCNISSYNQYKYPQEENLDLT